MQNHFTKYQMEFPNLLPKLSTEELEKLANKYNSIPNCFIIISKIQYILSGMNENDIKQIGLMGECDDLSDNINKLHIDICCKNFGTSKCASGLIPCAWSCRPGRDMAATYPTCYTDSDCPIIKLMFNYCSKLNKKICGDNLWIQKLLTELSYGISRIYVSFVKYAPKVNDKRLLSVFMGTDKPSEGVGFHIDNNFWCAEFPVMRKLLREGFIDDIVLKIIEHNKIVRELSVKYDMIDLPLWRRSWHPFDGINKKNSFVWSPMKEIDWDKWRSAPPRPHTTYDKILSIAKKWKKMSGLDCEHKNKN